MSTDIELIRWMASTLAPAPVATPPAPAPEPVKTPHQALREMKAAGATRAQVAAYTLANAHALLQPETPEIPAPVTAPVPIPKEELSANPLVAAMQRLARIPGALDTARAIQDDVEKKADRAEKENAR